jgi:Cytochrome c554 and c-prime
MPGLGVFLRKQVIAGCQLAKALLLLAITYSLLATGSPLTAQTVSDTRPELIPAQTHQSTWWPNRGSAPRNIYVGPGVCAKCHASIFKNWEKTQMADAMQPASDSEYLRANPVLTFQHGPYTYRIDSTSDQSIYSVSEGDRILSIPLLWAYGVGVVGQTFIFRLNGIYYETEIAYYPVLHRLSIVAGLSDSIPPTLQDAFGLPLVPVAAQQCVSCHTTAAVTGNRLHVDTMIRGVTCEACHGPGAQHVTQMTTRPKEPTVESSLIFNPATLDPIDLENFCGECHRSSRLVVAEDLHGLDTVHYEPYRLEMSPCWIMTRRITCVTCHDPHQPLQTDPRAYDSACLSCHASNHATATVSQMGKTCPVATKNCVTCHMPKCHLPTAPFTMSDHFIRIVGQDDACSKSS